MEDKIGIKELLTQVIDPNSNYWKLVMYVQDCLIFEFCKLCVG